MFFSLHPLSPLVGFLAWLPALPAHPGPRVPLTPSPGSTTSQQGQRLPAGVSLWLDSWLLSPSITCATSQLCEIPLVETEEREREKGIGNVLPIRKTNDPLHSTCIYEA